MANFDEDIKRITEDVLSDGTVDKIIREKVVECFESAIEDSFKWGELNKAIKARVTEVLVPFIEEYDMSCYIVKLDTILSEIVQRTSLVDNKKLLENFAYMMTEPVEKEIKLTRIFKEYKKYVAREMETYGRKVDWDEGEPEYEAMDVCFTFEQEDKKSWMHFEYGTIYFAVDDEEQQGKLNRTIRLSRWKKDKNEGWEIITGVDPNIYSLRNMDEFDLFLAKLQRAGVRMIIDGNCDEDYVRSDTKPEATYE